MGRAGLLVRWDIGVDLGTQSVRMAELKNGPVIWRGTLAKSWKIIQSAEDGVRKTGRLTEPHCRSRNAMWRSI